MRSRWKALRPPHPRNLRDDFDIDLGSYPASREDDVDINLDFGGATTDQPREEEDFELDFGSLATTEEPEVAEAEPEEESDAAQDALEAFRSELRGKPGDWYVVHTYSGMENRVLQNLENRVSSSTWRTTSTRSWFPPKRSPRSETVSASR